MVNSQRNILIGIIVLLALSMLRASAQTNSQLSLALIGQDPGQYVAPAGRTTTMRMEILNVVPSNLYLIQGEAYLDPNLRGVWDLVHSEPLGSFQLGYLQSAIWTFDLAVPGNIQAANVTDGMPQVNLLIKIIYQPFGGMQGVEQKTFVLGVPGASVQKGSNVIWYAPAGLLILVPIGIFATTRRRRGNRPAMFIAERSHVISGKLACEEKCGRSLFLARSF